MAGNADSNVILLTSTIIHCCMPQRGREEKVGCVLLILAWERKLFWESEDNLACPLILTPLQKPVCKLKICFVVFKWESSGLIYILHTESQLCFELGLLVVHVATIDFTVWPAYKKKKQEHSNILAFSQIKITWIMLCSGYFRAGFHLLRHKIYFC